MIDAHVDESLRKKIWDFEFIDLSRLLSKGRFNHEESGQRLEIVNRNGISFLSPVSDHELMSINSYFKWEQAFRLYSNILMSRYPNKATKLYQYSHTIQSAASCYIWDNVYSYDKEFRYHISRHPHRSWGVILQKLGPC